MVWIILDGTGFPIRTSMNEDVIKAWFARCDKTCTLIYVSLTSKPPQ